MALNSKSILLLGIAGAGGYALYEYWQYSSGVNTLATPTGSTTPDPTAVSSIETLLPFFTYLEMKLGMTSGATAQQLAVFNAMTGASPIAQSQQPGTTSTTQPTSVSTAPSTTPQPLPPVPVPAPTPPAPGSFRVAGSALASQMVAQINTTSANADQWNYAYRALSGGVDISTTYGFNFDTVYGPVDSSSGVRSSGVMNVYQFLQMAHAAATLTPAAIAVTSGRGATLVRGGTGTHIGFRGIGAISTFEGRPVSTHGNLLYMAHHPMPYSPTYALRGLGGVTQATGLEKVLFARQGLRSNRIR